MSDSFDHDRVAGLLRIIRDSVDMPEAIVVRDAALKELAAISEPLRLAMEKEVEARKAKAATLAAEAAAKHRNFPPEVATRLNVLSAAAAEAAAAYERSPNPVTANSRDSTAKAYTDALHNEEAAMKAQPRAIPSTPIDPSKGPDGQPKTPPDRRL